MKRLLPIVIGLTFFLCAGTPAQVMREKIDSVAVAKIKDEGMNRSQVMEILSYISDVYGPRLTWSPEFKQAAEWTSKKLKEWGLQGVHYDHWAPVGRGWTLKEFAARATEPRVFPLIAYPKAWSPGIGTEKAEVVWLDVKSLSDFDKYKGKLKGKFVLMSDPLELQAHFTPQGNRLADSSLLKMANAEPPAPGRGGRRFRFPRFAIQNFDSVMTFIKQFNPTADSAMVARIIIQQQVEPKKLEFVQNEGAIAALSVARGDGGTVFVQQATVPQPADVPFDQRVNPYDAKVTMIPQVAIASEHYNRMIRMIQKGQKLKIEITFEAVFTKPDSGFNIVAEIPGSDLKDEIVMIGAHFDSWHAGTGATDNGTGSSVCLEAVRILKALGLQPRRTIRIGLWGGEEEGLIGSREYVSEVFGKSDADAMSQMMGMGGGGGIKKTPEYDKLSVYFNNDNGSGKVRGVYMQGNEAVRPIFRDWLTQFNDPTAQTLTLQNTGGTDHLSFDAIGLPGFQFIQDQLEYDTRTHHSNMDVWDRAQEQDLKQAAVIMATFAYNAAMRDEKFPRKPTPTPPRAQATPGGN